MDTSSTTPALLRRVAQLEATVGRLSEDLVLLRSAFDAGAPKRTGARTVRRPAATGLAGAVLRGEAARVQWVRDGLLVRGEQLAQAWGLTRQALAPAAARGEIFALKIGNRLYYPRAFLGTDRQGVARICAALGRLDSTEKLMFWVREHGALGGRSVAAALEGGASLPQVERLADAWARERGAARDAAAA